jgi:regulator of sirC expression with transglutaminase-like and TPR domain
MSARTRARFAEIVRREPIDLALACQLIAAEVDRGGEVQDVAATLDRLAADARPVLAARAAAGAARPGGSPSGDILAGPDPAIAAAALRESLGLRAGFAGSDEDYQDLRASLLPAVLRRRRGLPILLSVVWLEVARRLGVPAYPVGLPGHVIVAIGTPRHNVLVDPFAGGRLITVHDAAAKVRAAGAAFSRSQLAPMGAEELLARVLGNIRVLAARAHAANTRLWAVELSLLLPHHPASLRRERGELRIRLGDFQGGAHDLNTFADAVEPAEPAAAAAARTAAVAARSRLN